MYFHEVAKPLVFKLSLFDFTMNKFCGSLKHARISIEKFCDCCRRKLGTLVIEDVDGDQMTQVGDLEIDADPTRAQAQTPSPAQSAAAKKKLQIPSPAVPSRPKFKANEELAPDQTDAEFESYVKDAYQLGDGSEFISCQLLLWQFCWFACVII